MYRRLILGSLLVLLVCGLCVWSIWPPVDKIKLGLDLKGGTLLVYKLDMGSHIAATEQAGVADEVKKVVYSRLDRYGLKEIEVRVVGTVGEKRIQVAIPSVSPDEIKDLKEQIGKAGNLTLHLCVPEFAATPPTDEKVQEVRGLWDTYKRELEAWNATVTQKGVAAAGPRPKEPAQIACVKYKEDKKTGQPAVDPVTREFIPERWFILHNEPDLKVSGSYIQSANRTIDQQMGENAVAFAFHSVGATKLSNITNDNVGKLLAIVLDDVVLSAPVIKAHLSEGRGIITGNFKEAEARGLANILSVGSLPTSPTLMQEQTIGSRLGKDSIESGRLAVIWGFVFVIVFMIVYYRGLGVVADIALLVNLLMVLSYVALFRQSLSFPGIAGLLLTVGMSVDANILIFERMREEFRKEKGVDQAVAAGFDRAFWAIFDSNLTTFITGVVLFKVGTGPIQGFAITLMAGLVANFVTAIYMSRLLVSVFYKLGLLRKFGMGELTWLKEPKFAFIAKQRIFLTASAIVLAAGLAFVLWRGKDSVGIDFRGGTEVSITLETPLDIKDFRQRLENITDEGDKLFADAQLQASLATPDGKYRGFLVRVPYTEETKRAQLEQRKGATEATPAPQPPALVPPTAPAPTAPSTPAPAPGGPAVPAPTSPAPAPEAPAVPAPTAPAPAPEAPAVPTPTAPAPTPEAPKADASTTTSGSSAAPASQDAGEQPELSEAPAVKTRAMADRYRHAIEKTFAAELAPVAFPLAEDQPVPLNPDMRVGVLQVSFYTGGDQKKQEFANELKRLMNGYLEVERALVPKTAGKAPIGKYSIVDVELLDDQKSGAFSIYGVMTSPMKYGEADAPANAEQVLVRLRQFFSSDYYRKQAMLPEYSAAYGQFFVSEPVPSVSFVDSAVAADFQGSAMMAVLVSFLAVLFYLGIRFELTYGVGAVVAVLHDVVVGVIALALVDFLFGAVFSVKIDLQVIAGLLTLIGFSLNDTIVIFDRIRENLARDRKTALEDLVNTSINQTLSRTVLTTFTVFITVVVLLIWGGESARSFTTCMLAGVISGTYSTIFIASPVMIYLRRRKERKHEERIRAAAEA